MKHIFILFTLLTFSNNVFATDSKLDQLSAEYIEVVNLKNAVSVLLNQFKQVTSGSIDQLFEKMDNGLSGKQLELAKQQFKERDALKEKFIADTLSWKNLKHEYIKIYSSSYTKEELTALINFNKSPVGKSILKKQAMVQMKSMKMSQELMMKVMPQFLMEFKKIAKKQRQGAYKRACFANQRTLLGAIEMYSLDYSIDLEIKSDKDIQMLVDMGYLMDFPNHSGESESKIYKTDKCGNVWCTEHGNHDNKCEPCKGSKCKMP